MYQRKFRYRLHPLILMIITWLDSQGCANLGYVADGARGFSVAAVTGDSLLAGMGKLFQVMPTPFDSELTVVLTERPARDVTLTAYNITGRMVRRLPVGPSRKKYKWDGCDTFGRRLPTGIYFLRLETRELRESLRVVLVR